MRLTDLNPGGGIGANCLLLEFNGIRIVIDAGIHPEKTGNDALPSFKAIPDESVDLVILTHCHLDHLGALPVVARHQSRAAIVMSVPSHVLARRMLHNSVNVMKRQREEANVPEYPFYTHAEIERLHKRTLALNYGRRQEFDFSGGTVEITLHASGHVPGAAGVEIAADGERVFVSGDVLFTNQHILRGADFPSKAFDTVITETTRGRTERPAHKMRQDEIARLLKTIEETRENGGSVLIPTFALGRMQEIFSILSEARRDGHIPRCAIYGSGLGMDLADYFDEITRKTRLMSFRRSVLKELNVKPCPDMRPGRAPKPGGIFVVSSGMMVANTPSYGVAASLLHEPQNTLCFVGYCDPATPGGKLLATEAGQPFHFEALEYETKMQARIERFDLSGHADREELLNYAIDRKPSTIVLVHGDPEARNWFSAQLKEKTPDTRILDPEPLEPYEV